MRGEARFDYTAADMIAAQRAGWSWLARWRNAALAYLALVACNGAFLLGLNAVYGTRPVATDAIFAAVASAPELAVLLGLLLLSAAGHARQMLRGKVAGAWSGRTLQGEHRWAWDGDGLHIGGDRAPVDLAWSSIGAWLDAPGILLLYAAGHRSFSLPEPVLDAGWREAPKLLVYPFGGFVLALPKRAMSEEDRGRLVDLLRTAGARERRPFGLQPAPERSARPTERRSRET